MKQHFNVFHFNVLIRSFGAHMEDVLTIEQPNGIYLADSSIELVKRKLKIRFFFSNGVKDCVDNSDELTEQCLKDNDEKLRGKCSAEQFQCNSGECIPLDSLCTYYAMFTIKKIIFHFYV